MTLSATDRVGLALNESPIAILPLSVEEFLSDREKLIFSELDIPPEYLLELVFYNQSTYPPRAEDYTYDCVMENLFVLLESVALDHELDENGALVDTLAERLGKYADEIMALYYRFAGWLTQYFGDLAQPWKGYGLDTVEVVSKPGDHLELHFDLFKENPHAPHPTLTHREPV